MRLEVSPRRPARGPAFEQHRHRPFNLLFGKKNAGLQPYEIARQRRGRVAIANSDAGWNAYAHEAIDQAWRAVSELKHS